MRVKNITAKPIYHRDSYTLAVQSHVIEYFYEVIFGPIIGLCKEAGLNLKTRENAGRSPLVRALESGKIWYASAHFTGEFSAEISREIRAMGGKFDKASKSFFLPSPQLSIEVRNAAEASFMRAEALHRQISKTLTQMEGNVPKAPVGLNLHSAVDNIVADLQKQFVATVGGIESIEVAAQLTPGITKALREEFTTNLDLYIKKFALDEIPKLRAKVEENAFAGFRTDRLAKIIEQEYGVTQRKAEFLADQETSLLVSKFREQRYRECGCTRYKWSTSHDERVRPDHKKLNQSVQSFDLPPVTNLKTGARNNPGEDFRCRCVAIPILDIELT